MPTMPTIDEPDTWALLIPDYFPPSLNQTAMAHWSSVRRHKKRALELLHTYATAAGGAPVFEGPVRVTITRLIGYRQRALDPDNLQGSVKPLVDAMRAEKAGRNQRGRNRHGGLGIITEDDPAMLELHVGQCKGLALPTLQWMRDLGLEPEGPTGLSFRGPGRGSGTVIVVEGERVA